MGLSNLRIIGWNFRVSSAIIIILMVTIPLRNAWGVDASPSPTFTLVGAALKLENGAEKGKATMLLKTDGLNRDKKDYPDNPDIVKDIGVPFPPEVHVIFSAKAMQVGDTSRSWLLTAEIDHLPGNTSQKRYLEVRYSGFTGTLDYTLTNKFETAFSWTLKPPPSEISIRSGEPIEIGIAVGAVPASNVKLLQATLIEKSRKYPLAEAGLTLCKKSSGDCDSEINLEAHSSNRLWLRTKDDKYPVGQFQGSVVIAAAQKPEGDTINLTVFATRGWRQFGGIIVIMLGVGISWLVSTYARSRLARNQVRLFAAFMREKFKRLQTKLIQAPPQIIPKNTETTSGKLKKFLEDLSESALDSKGYLPDTIPKPYLGGASKLEDFKAVLQKMDGWAVALEMIISRGMANAWDFLSTHPTNQSDINATVGQLDELAKGDDVPADLKTQIDKKVNDLKTKLQIPETPSGKLKEGEEEIERLKFEIDFINLTVWIVMLALTTLLGSYIVVWSNLGFGLWGDYLLCLFWGFGISIGGQQILQMTSGSVATALSITK